MRARCEQCFHDLTVTTTGVACACQTMDHAAIAALMAAYESIPDFWPLLDLFDLLYEVYHVTPSPTDAPSADASPP